MSQTFFYNYQHNKIDIISPDITNGLIIILFFFLVLIFTKKGIRHDFLSKLHTEQLKGVAIFLVILGHLWMHVAKTKAQIILSGEAVSLFLILSGFGLTCSGNFLNFKNFFSKRISRVLIPYWIATILILLLDYFLLGNFLRPLNIALTFVGANFSEELSHIDYVRWFVTFILVWYALFFLFSKLTDKLFVLLLLLASIILLPLEYYIFNFGWYQFFSFPVGCALARYKKELQKIYNDNRKIFIIISFLVIPYAIGYKIVLADNKFTEFFNVIPNFILFCLVEGNSVVLSLACIIISGFFIEKGYTSTVLCFLGKYSYELFLLHGAFLIKYNFAIRTNANDPFSVILGFFAVLLFLALISWLFSAGTNIIQKMAKLN